MDTLFSLPQWQDKVKTEKNTEKRIQIQASFFAQINGHKILFYLSAGKYYSTRCFLRPSIAKLKPRKRLPTQSMHHSSYPQYFNLVPSTNWNTGHEIGVFM